MSEYGYAEWWHYTTEQGTYFATLKHGVEIWRDGELVATAPQRYGLSGNYVVTLTDGTVVGDTNWLQSVVAIAAHGLEK